MATCPLCSSFRNTGGSQLTMHAQSTTPHCGSCGNGHLPVVWFLAEHTRLTAMDARARDNQALPWSCEDGHLPIVRFLAEHWRLTADDFRAGENYALRESCINDHLLVVQYLAEHIGLTAEDARTCDNEAPVELRKGHLPVVQFLAEHCGSLQKMRAQTTTTHCGGAA
mmetsp:Transcript_4449/g.11000  ORF Transcript_4449/g.11000 Transcript_4449/m.11000 type:complete len:168 (+) Transcript_4449:499-1002(+)